MTSADKTRPAALFRKWWTLPLSQKLVVAHIVLAALFVEATIRVVRVNQLARWLGMSLRDAREPNPTPYSGADFGAKELRRARLTIEVMEHWPFAEGTCLRQALLVGHFLRHHGPVLKLGVRKDGAEIATHAWVEVADSTIGLDSSFLPFRQHN